MFKLHITKISTDSHSANVQFAALFAQYEGEAREVVETGVMTAADLWSLAQYLDLAEAGHAGRTDSLVHQARAAIRGYLANNASRPEVHALCGRSSCLSSFVRESLDRAADESFEAQRQTLAA
jgi:hypothetical protein